MNAKGPRVITAVGRRLLVAAAFLTGVIGLYSWSRVWQYPAGEVLTAVLLVGLLLGALRLWVGGRKTPRHW